MRYSIVFSLNATHHTFYILLQSFVNYRREKFCNIKKFDVHLDKLDSWSMRDVMSDLDFA
jgi:hypothetical protein